ncbi:uncharacterized protein LOC117902905 isoform X2 [Drosophila subobscura]|uniref:uncharacterized protein LOC117902905 isoform X2 n=1 Tax=Drosophila subobscura TaxID=7241 RepID=UPI00155A108F|nr:uncharacterized protein LOC117902905 isoform X2 [Drosophila subobscura]
MLFGFSAEEIAAHDRFLWTLLGPEGSDWACGGCLDAVAAAGCHRLLLCRGCVVAKDWMLLLLLVAGRLQVSLPWLRRR